MTSDDEVTATLKAFAARLSPTLGYLSQMYATYLGRQLARGEDLQPTFAAMEHTILMVAESADYRRRKRLKETVGLPVEVRLSELILTIIHDLPIPLERSV